MAYEPLHLKYRPQRFADVVGQSAVTQTLANAIRLNRIAPAYLFCGPRGTGKTSSARILAKSLNCVNGPTADPCNVCQSCREIAQGTALDVIEIDAASNTGVDNIRELIERAQFAPVSSRYKVYVLDEVHMLSSAAFNALLKTLEEPPERVIFVLATTDPQRVLPTVISRCQRFDYRRIPLGAMVEHLTDIAWKEGINITDQALELVAQLSQGGLRDAESLLDQLSLLEGEISVNSVWDLVGAVPEQQLLSLLDAIQQQNPEQVLTQTRHLLDHGKEPLVVLQNLVSLYRDLLLAKTAPGRQDLVALTPDTWQALQQRGPHYTTQGLLAAQAHLRQAEPQLRQSSQPQLWLEITLLDLLPVLPASVTPESQGVIPNPQPQARPVPVPASPVPTPSPPPPSPHSQSQSQSLPDPSPRPSPDPPSAPPSPTPSVAQPSAHSTSLTQSWPKFLARLKSPVIRALMDLGSVIEESQTEVTLGFPNQGFAEKAKSKLAQIQPLIDELLGRPIKVQFGIKPPQSTAPSADVEIGEPQPAEKSMPKAPTPDPEVAFPNGKILPVEPSPAPMQTPLAASVSWDELDRASKHLAEFFNGVVVKEEADLTGVQEGWTDLEGAGSAESDDLPVALGPGTTAEPEEDELPF